MLLARIREHYSVTLTSKELKLPIWKLTDLVNSKK